MTYLEFLQNHIQRFGEGSVDGDEATVVIMDNAAQHRAEGVNEWAVENRIRLLTLPPYSPELNPAEKIINSIKSKVRKDRYSFDEGNNISKVVNEQLIIQAYEENLET